MPGLTSFHAWSLSDAQLAIEATATLAFALCAFVGAWVVVASAATVTLLRGLAMLPGWRLPAWRSGAPGPD